MLARPTWGAQALYISSLCPLKNRKEGALPPTPQGVGIRAHKIMNGGGNRWTGRPMAQEKSEKAISRSAEEPGLEQSQAT